MSIVGANVTRVEDGRVLTGRGRYIDDLRLPRMVQAAFLRSHYPHARIAALDASLARTAPGVVAVLTGDDLKKLVRSLTGIVANPAGLPEFHALATDRVRFVGDPVAVVVAGTRWQAEDAAELIDVSYDPLPGVATVEQALAPSSPVLFDDMDSNVAADESASFGDVDAVFASADRVVVRTFRQHRVAPVPMETRGAVADYDPGVGELTFHCNAQNPHALRMALTDMLGLPLERVRVLVGDVGGSFGLKASFAREGFCLAAAAVLLGRPVKWAEDRYEHMVAAGQSREEKVDIEIAVTDEGTLLGVRVHLTMDQGSYPKIPFPAAQLNGLVRTLLPGPYRWQAYAFRRTAVVTNKCTAVAYRGPWAVETRVHEWVLDEVARELRMDPAELRRRNMVTGEAHDRLITGPSLAGASSLQSLERALELIGYEDFRRDQAAVRADGRHQGIGFATFIESAPGPPEMRAGSSPVVSEEAKVKLDSNGHLLVVTSQIPQGQSHETTLAQVAADEMGISFEDVRVVSGDTRFTPFKFIGTGGSLSATWATGAVRLSTRKVKEKVLAIAGELLEISPEDLVITDGVIVAHGVPSKTLPLAQVALQATTAPSSLPVGTDHLLEAQERFTGEGITGSGWSGGTHACTVEVDVETGRVEILRYVVTEDCGRVINPAVVEGQICGGVAQGIGEVLYEHAAYDQDGNFLTSTFMDYLLPTAVEIPRIEIEHLNYDPDGDFASRGVGEGGAIVSPAAVTNAIADAMAPFGVRVCGQHLPPAKILELAHLIRSTE